MKKKNIIHREVFAEVPPKVVYSLTNTGRRLKPVLEEMFNWGGIEYTKEFGKISEDNLCESNICK